MEELAKQFELIAQEFKELAIKQSEESNRLLDMAATKDNPFPSMDAYPSITQGLMYSSLEKAFREAGRRLS